MWDALYKTGRPTRAAPQDGVRIRLPFLVTRGRAGAHRARRRGFLREIKAIAARAAARRGDDSVAEKVLGGQDPPGEIKAQEGAMSIIDTDIHERADLAICSRTWTRSGTSTSPTAGWIPDRVPALHAADRRRARPRRREAGRRHGPAGRTSACSSEQLLDEYDIEQGILTGWLNASAMQEGWTEFKTALMSAYNDWQLENWIEQDDRLFGSVHVNACDPKGAAREIDRIADAPPHRAGDALHRRPAVRRPASTTRSSRRPRATSSSSASTTARTRRPRSASTATSPSGTRSSRRCSCREVVSLDLQRRVRQAARPEGDHDRGRLHATCRT